MQKATRQQNIIHMHTTCVDSTCADFTCIISTCVQPYLHVTMYIINYMYKDNSIVNSAYIIRVDLILTLTINKRLQRHGNQLTVNKHYLLLRTELLYVKNCCTPSGMIYMYCIP